MGKKANLFSLKMTTNEQLTQATPLSYKLLVTHL